MSIVARAHVDMRWQKVCMMALACGFCGAGLHMACANGHTDIVRLLLDSGAVSGTCIVQPDNMSNWTTT